MFDPKDVSKFVDKINTSFENIKKELNNLDNFENINTRVRSGLRDNRDMTIQNEEHYAEMKEQLWTWGEIDYDSPLSVTGQLINDYHMKLMSTNPDDLQYNLTFKNDPRLRPTYQSMVRVYREEIEELEYKESGSLDLVTKLQIAKGYPIIDTINKVYSKDYVNKVMDIIQEQFKRVDNDTGDQGLGGSS